MEVERLVTMVTLIIVTSYLEFPKTYIFLNCTLVKPTCIISQILFDTLRFKLMLNLLMLMRSMGMSSSTVSNHLLINE